MIYELYCQDQAKLTCKDRNDMIVMLQINLEKIGLVE